MSCKTQTNQREPQIKTLLVLILLNLVKFMTMSSFRFTTTYADVVDDDDVGEPIKGFVTPFAAGTSL